MFETLTLYSLQQYWWVIVSLLGSILVFLMFVQGGQTLIYTLGKNETERTILVNSLGRKWEFTFTTLVTFGGAFFASFPLFYSTSFGGAYFVWMLILLAFILQAVAYEFRSKPANIFGHRTYETFLLINGVLATLLIGTAVGTFFTGSMFSMNKLNLTDLTNNAISRWETPTRGLEAALNITNIMLGLSVFFLARTLGLLYFINNINHNTLIIRARKQVIYNAIPFLIFFLIFLGSILLKEGFAYDANTLVVSIAPYKYLHNLLEMPTVFSTLLIGVILVIYGLYITLFKQSTKGIWFTGSGTVLAVLALFLTAGLNHTCFYPSTFDLQSSLNIENASSSHYTLTVMSYVSLMVPFVIAYIIYAWRAINNKKLDEQELNEEHHVY